MGPRYLFGGLHIKWINDRFPVVHDAPMRSVEIRAVVACDQSASSTT
jgi:hypothetical protein